MLRSCKFATKSSSSTKNQKSERVMSLLYDKNAVSKKTFKKGYVLGSLCCQLLRTRSVIMKDPSKSLNLSFLASVHCNYDIGCFCSLCKGLRQLCCADNNIYEELYLCGNEMGILGAIELSNVLLQPYCALQVLNISMNNLGPNDVRSICDAVSLCQTRLKLLDMSSNNVGPDGCKWLRDMLLQMECLETLILSNNCITCLGVAYLCESLKRNSVLKQLDIGGNNIGDAGAWFLGEMLETNRHLKMLYMPYCFVTSSGCASVFKALPQNKTLKVLSMCGSLIDDLCAYHLAHALRNCPTISEIYLFPSIVHSDHLLEALLSNGSLTNASFNEALEPAVERICQRNRDMHARASESCSMLLAIRLQRSSILNAAPKEIVTMITRILLETKKDCFAGWN